MPQAKLTNDELVELINGNRDKPLVLPDWAKKKDWSTLLADGTARAGFEVRKGNASALALLDGQFGWVNFNFGLWFFNGEIISEKPFRRRKSRKLDFIVKNLFSPDDRIAIQSFAELVIEQARREGAY